MKEIILNSALTISLIIGAIAGFKIFKWLRSHFVFIGTPLGFITAFVACSMFPAMLVYGVLGGTINEVDKTVSNITKPKYEKYIDDAEQAETTEEKIKDFPAVSSLIHEGKTPEEILKMIFDDVEITNRQDLFFTCDCSREKMINALSTIGKQELQSMIDEDHGCEITCQFCNTKYQFSEEELQNLINRL